MARRRRLGIGAGLGAGVVAVSSFLVVALATAGPTAAVLPAVGKQTAGHPKTHRSLAGSVRTTISSAKKVGGPVAPPRRGRPISGPGGPTDPGGGGGGGSGGGAGGGSGGGSGGSGGGSLPPGVLAEIRANADWIVQSQLPDGALATYIDRAHVAPYGSGYAALGLARAAKVTGDQSYLAAAWRFLSWYQAHEDANGYTTDYDVTNGVETSTGDMDSTDAYAGMFLTAAGATWQVSQDGAKLAALAPGIAGALRAIESTQDSDGLTWAKPSYHAKYAMDQAETYAGLRAAAQLEQALGNSSLAERAASDADRLQQGFARLWVASLQSFSPAVAGDGVHEPVDWTNLYPGALEEIWPVAFGLATGTRAQEIVQHFASSHPEWDAWYWPVAGWAFQAVGLDSAAQTASVSIEKVAAQANHDWPFTSATAGQLILLESGGFAS